MGRDHTRNADLCMRHACAALQVPFTKRLPCCSVLELLFYCTSGLQGALLESAERLHSGLHLRGRGSQAALPAGGRRFRDAASCHD